MDKTIDVLTFLAQQLIYINNVVGIQLINEPNNVPGLADFCEYSIANHRFYFADCHDCYDHRYPYP